MLFLFIILTCPFDRHFHLYFLLFFKREIQPALEKEEKMFKKGRRLGGKKEENAPIDGMTKGWISLLINNEK